MIRGGDNTKVTDRDFRVAHDIWEKDVTSMRGKTKKRSTAVADISIVLSVDIMFVDSISSLVAVATPLDLVLVVPLKSSDMGKSQRTAAAVLIGLDDMIWYDEWSRLHSDDNI
jgi:hypothetical protein